MSILIGIGLSLLLLYGILSAWMGLWVRGKHRSGAPSADERPLFSVLVPFHNEEQHLPQLLAMLRLWDVHVLLIDDGSTDGSRALAESFASEHPKAKVLSSQGQGKKAALRSGLAEAKGSHLILLDADVQLPANWLEDVRRQVEKGEADLYLFPVLISEAGNFREGFEALDVLSLQGTSAAFAHAGRPWMGSGACMIVRSEAYRRAVDFLHVDHPSGDDVFLVQHLRRQGARIVFLSEASTAAKVLPRLNWSAFIRQRIRWGQKANAYPDWLAQGIAWLVFFVNFSAVFAWVLFFLSGELAFLLHPAGKAVFDLMLLWPAARVFQQRTLLRFFPLSSIVYPFYVTFAASVALFTHPDVIARRWRQKSSRS